MRIVILIVMMCLTTVNVFAAEDGVTHASPALINLPKPQTDGGKPLMQALRERRTTRDFSDRKLPLQVLSDLLWSAFGVNRPDSGRRTAPSAYNQQEIDIYMVLPEGIYLYEPKTHGIKPVANEDFRALTGSQDFVAVAPVNFVYVADYSRMGRIKTDTDKDLYSAIDTGLIVQNVYLYCASEGLATVTHVAGQGKTLRKAMKLRPDQKIILAQTIGYEKAK